MPTVLRTGSRLPGSENPTLSDEILPPTGEIVPGGASVTVSSVELPVSQSSDEFMSRTVWNGLEVPYRCIAARYHIIWNPALGHGTYGSVLEVFQPLKLSDSRQLTGKRKKCTPLTSVTNTGVCA